MGRPGDPARRRVAQSTGKGVGRFRRIACLQVGMAKGEPAISG
jgi:hypothetical protein